MIASLKNHHLTHLHTWATKEMRKQLNKTRSQRTDSCPDTEHSRLKLLTLINPHKATLKWIAVALWRAVHGSIYLFPRQKVWTKNYRNSKSVCSYVSFEIWSLVRQWQHAEFSVAYVSFFFFALFWFCCLECHNADWRLLIRQFKAPINAELKQSLERASASIYLLRYVRVRHMR